MIREGQIVVFTFPQTNLGPSKLRPALVLQKLPGKYNDWLTCMVTSKLNQQIHSLDELVSGTDSDYSSSGLKAPSVIRITRLAVQDSLLIRGTIGEISPERLIRIRLNLSRWISGSQ